MKRVVEMIAILLLPYICLAAEESSVVDSLDQIPVYEMPGITVTATRIPRRLSDVPLGTEVITASEIEESGASDVGELLRSGVGVDVKSYGYLGSASFISIRGSASSQVLVLVDGRPINSVSLGVADLSEVTLSDVRRVEVVRGPVSSLWGANALGGVVNIITGSTSEKTSTKGTAEFGSYRKQVYSASASSFLGGLGFNLSTMWRAGDGERDNSDYEGRKFSGKIGYSGIEWLNADLSGALERFELGLPGPIPDSISKYGNEEVTSLSDRQKNDKRYLDLSVEMKLSEKNRGRAKFYYERREMDCRAVYDGWDSNTFSYYKAIEDDDYLTTVVGTNLQFEVLNAVNDGVVVGFDVAISKFDATQVVLNDSTKEETVTRWTPSDTVFGIYVESHFHPTEMVGLIGSARYDRSWAYGDRISPNAGIIAQFSPSARAKFSIGQAFRAPTLNDLYWPESEWTGGNPDLRPEIGVGMELRVEYEPLELLNVASSVFRRDVENLIVWAPSSDYKWRPTNLNEFHSNGIEVEFELGPISGAKLKGHLTYNYAFQKDQEAGDRQYDWSLVERRAAFIPKTKGYLSGSYKAPFGLDFLMDVEYTGRRVTYFEDYIGFNPVTVEKWLESAAVVNGNVGFNVGPQYFFIKVDNIFDSRYSEEFGYGLTDRDYPRPGRTFSYGMKIQLK